MEKEITQKIGEYLLLNLKPENRLEIFFREEPKEKYQKATLTEISFKKFNFETNADVNSKANLSIILSENFFIPVEVDFVEPREGVSYVKTSRRELDDLEYKIFNLVEEKNIIQEGYTQPEFVKELKTKYFMPSIPLETKPQKPPTEIIEPQRPIGIQTPVETTETPKPSAPKEKIDLSALINEIEHLEISINKETNLCRLGNIASLKLDKLEGCPPLMIMERFKEALKEPLSKKYSVEENDLKEAFGKCKKKLKVLGTKYYIDFLKRKG